ncbi:hypothetical protein [Streptomyces sp. 1331.2]|nr:hypothetical protein [Streptomyces sp. 1331.2]SOB81320.1 hypothetical protein SAMN06272789_1447 [Streptomyces sp. 1331.2]
MTSDETTIPAVTAFIAFIALPYGEELLRCARARTGHHQNRM